MPPRVISHMRDAFWVNVPHVGSIIKRFGRRVRKLRGDESLDRFARKLGISKSSLQRIEMGEQNLTITTLEGIAFRLKISLSELLNFPE